MMRIDVHGIERAPAVEKRCDQIGRVAGSAPILVGPDATGLDDPRRREPLDDLGKEPPKRSMAIGPNHVRADLPLEWSAAELQELLELHVGYSVHEQSR